MTLQEIFDKVVAHARAQKAQAIDEFGMCWYRGLNGTKCFIGALIPDELYRPEFEGQACFNNCVRAAAGLEAYDPDDPFNQMKLATRLQGLHDCSPIEEWEGRFESIATEYGLTYNPPTE